MERKKIKLDTSNFFQVEKNASILDEENKIKNIIEKLLASKNNPEAMTGWINLQDDIETFSEIQNFVETKIKEDKYEHLLVFGIGGSSLGAQALLDGINTPFWNRLAKGKRKNFLTIDFIDNLDPQLVREILSKLKLDKTLFLTISKAGGTVETIVPMLIAKEWTGNNFYNQSIFVTSKGKGLLFDIAQKNAVKCFYIPENVGGRFSVFSPVGLLPAAFCGLNLNEIREGILAAAENSQCKEIKNNLSAMIALAAYFSYKSGKNIFVLMPYSSCLRKFVDWFVQLWAESIGKNLKGSTPIPAIGATDQHSQIQLFNQGPNDKLTCFIKINKHKRDLTVPDFSSETQDFRIYAGHKVGEILNIELNATKRAMTENGRANFTISLPELNEYYLSYVMYTFEMATAIMGNLLEVNPFDQPGVELGKKYIKEELLNK